MAENKMTVQEAVDLITNNKLEFSDQQLAQMNEAFFNDFTNNPGNDVKDARDIALGLAEERITALAAQDSYDAADLDSIMALAGSISAFSREADIAKEVLAKAQKQKDELAASAPENGGKESEQEYEVGETAAGDTQANEEQVEDVSVNEGAEVPAPENQHDTAEPEVSVGTEDVEEQMEEAENIPEDQAALEAFDKEYGIDTMTAEQLEKNAEVMDASEFHPFELNEEGKLVHPEFQDEYDAIQNLEITDDNGEPLSEEEQKKAKENLLETAIFEADMLTRGTAKGDEEAVKAQYVSNLKSSLQKAVVSTAFASEIEGKPQNRETYGAAFAKAASQEGGLKTSLKNIMAYAGVVNGEMTKLRDRLQNKFKEIPAVQKMSAKIAAFDKSMGEKHPKMWKTAKRVGGILAKRAKGIAVYTAVGATAGPIGLAALAVKSGYDSYKGLSEKAKKEGMTLGQYAKTHKMEVGLAFTTSALSLAGSALGLGAGGSEMAQTVSPYLKTATRALAIGPKAAKAAFHGLKAAAIKMGWKKGNVQEELAAAKAALNQTVDATIGMVAGSYLNEGIQGLQSQDDNQVDGITGESVSINNDAAMGPETPEAFDARMTAEAAAFDKDGDGIADVLDIDHGEGWATANETQLDRLMDADARGVNAILNDGKWHSSAELKDMMDNGQFTEDQLKAIHALASREFDENGHIIDKDLNKLYEDLARQAAKSAELQEEVKDEEPVIENEPQERTPAEQKMYDSILATISKGEDMNDPAVKASVEALAEGYFNDVKGALAAGNEQAAVNLLHGLHKQGEAVEVQEATQREEDDSRGVRHAKEDLAKVSSELDNAKAALAADPNNEKLQKEVEKLEKEFDKKSLNLDNKEIKQERSELKDQINRDNTSVKNLDWTREQVEKDCGVSQADADKRLAAAGFDLNNLPQDTANLSPEIQNLINAHNRYAQVDQTEAALRGRINENEQAREDLKAQEKENKEAMKDVKKGRGFSTDDEKRAGIEDRLPGQSDFRDSELASSLVGMARGENEAATQEPEKVESNEEAVDKFLRDQVAQGKMTEDEASEHREALIKAADERKANMEYAQQLGNPDNWQEYQAKIEPSPIMDKPKEAPVYQPEKEGATSNKEQEEKQETSEVVVEPLVAESKAGNISYSMDDNGQYKTGGTISVINDYEKYKDIEKEISAGMGNTPGKSMIVGHKTQIAYMADAINKDIEARMARGEDVPHAKEMMDLNNKQLKAMGLEYDKEGHLHSSKANGGNIQTRGKDRD